MNRELSLAVLACIFFSHSAKPETKQRLDATPRAASSFDTVSMPKKAADAKVNECRKERRAGRKKSFKQQELAAADFRLLESKPVAAAPHDLAHPLFANRYLEDKKRVSLFVTRVDFSRDGVALFLNQTFNNRDYGTEFLPYSLTHLTQFLEFAHAKNQSPEFIEGAFRLFNQKIKNAPFVTAPALERFMEKTTPYLQAELAVTPFSLWQESKQLLSQAFREKFSFAQKDPLGFFEYVSKGLAHEVDVHLTTPDRVRATCMRFLSCSTDKIIWSPADQAETWHCFKKLGEHFHALHLKKVIPDELDANELYWSLVERYCHFLKLTGTRLSLDTCKIIKQDLSERTIPWLLQKEQESVLETKMERLTIAVLETEARIHANAQGIITDTIALKRS